MEEEVIEQLRELREVTPEGALSVFGKFEGECRGYYERGAEDVELIYDAFMGHMFDEFMRDFRAEREEKLPELCGEEPEWYGDAKAIFKGRNGELNAFKSVLTADVGAFGQAYEMNGGPPPLPVTWRNALLELWTREIEEAMAQERERLRGIKEYALRRYEPWSPPLLEEELGRRQEPWGNHCAELMQAIYVLRNWAWVFETFSLEEGEPEFLRELRNEYRNRVGDEREGSGCGAVEVPQKVEL